MIDRNSADRSTDLGTMLYLVRHAHAVAAEKDQERPLSRRGRKQVRTLARWMRQTGVFQPETIWHSPLVRSQETAALLVQRVHLAASLTLVAGLEPDDDPRRIARRLRTTPAALAIVGHEPHLIALATLLVMGNPDPARFVMKKCAVLALEREGARWRVCWHVSPEVIS